jgi:predicted nuclease of predicted toxin-antitoxin system
MEDREILDKACSEDRILLTFDLDFGDLLAMPVTGFTGNAATTGDEASVTKSFQAISLCSSPSKIAMVANERSTRGMLLKMFPCLIGSSPLADS